MEKFRLVLWERWMIGSQFGLYIFVSFFSFLLECFFHNFLKGVIYALFICAIFFFCYLQERNCIKCHQLTEVEYKCKNSNIKFHAFMYLNIVFLHISYFLFRFGNFYLKTFFGVELFLRRWKIKLNVRGNA